MIRFKRIDHVQLCIPPGMEQQAREFYKNILGLTEINKPGELIENGGMWFMIADIQLHIGIESQTNHSKAHPAFEVENIREIKTMLLDKNVKIREEIQVKGCERFSIFDPFGNRIELLEKINM